MFIQYTLEIFVNCDIYSRICTPVLIILQITIYSMASYIVGQTYSWLVLKDKRDVKGERRRKGES